MNLLESTMAEVACIAERGDVHVLLEDVTKKNNFLSVPYTEDSILSLI